MGTPVERQVGWAVHKHARAAHARAVACDAERVCRNGGAPFLFLAVAAALALLFGLRAAAAATAGTTFVVTSTTDAVDANLSNAACATSTGACTLRAAIQQANALAGDDVIQVPAGTYAIAIAPQNENLANSGDFDVTAPVTIVGAGPGATILDGGAPSSSAPEIRGRDRVLEVHAAAGNVTLTGLTIREGYSAEQGGGVYTASPGTLRLDEVRVLDSYAAKYGGGIANAGAGRVELVGSTASGNGAKEGGSAIHNAVAGTISITSASAIVDNPGSGAAHYPITGGAINNEGAGDTIGTIEVLDSTVARNEAASNGAGIHNERDGRVIVVRSTIAENRTSASGAGIYSNSGTVLVRDGTVISDNHAGNLISSGNGGGIYNGGKASKSGTPGRVEIASATITRNTATADGAGIAGGLDAELVIADSTISNNDAAGEGGGVSVQAKGDAAVARTTFTGNSAEVAGGGAYVYAEGTATFEDSTFTDNRAGATGGGGLLTDGSGSVSIVRSTFLRNRAVGDGGGLLVSSGGTQTIADSIVSDNHTDEGGGGIFNSGMVVTLERMTIAGNSALLDGGGIKSEGSGQFTIVDTEIAGNTAANGGGFTNAADGTMLVSGSIFRDNSAQEDGGGYLEIGDANSQIVNSTLSANRAGDRGGGVYTDADAELRVTNVTITDNTALAGSGLSTSVESVNFPVVPASRVILRNTIVAGNHDGINCHGAVFSEGGNIDDGTTCFFSDPRDLTRAGAGVEPLAANGGPTPTHALRPTSIAIDRAVAPCPELDQRGVERPKNVTCDIGAFEFEGTPGVPDSNPLPPPTGPDSEPPTVSIDAKPPLRTLDRVAEFRFRADEIARFECVLNPPAASFSGCESPHDYANLALGPNTFQVRAIDAAGNIGPAESYTWRIVEELVPPETTILSEPDALTRETGATFTFSASEPASFSCSLDDAELAACTSPHVLTGLADGPHVFQVRAIDGSFNEDETPASRSWTVDTAAPETTIGNAPSTVTNDATPELTFSSEAGATFECRIDAAAFAGCGSPFVSPPLGDGAHTFEVRATDVAGNEDSTPAGAAFTVDTVAPDTTMTGPEGLSADSTPTYEIASSEAGVELECRVDGGTFAACSSPHTTAALADGAHAVEARARDAAGNVDPTPASRALTVDTSAPETTISAGPDALTREAGASIAFSASEPSTFACSVDGSAYASCASPLVLTGLADGSHRVDVRATDTAGNADDSPASRQWTVDTTPPETAINEGPVGSTNDATPQFAFSSEEGATFECALDGAEWAPCQSPLTAAVLADGEHTFAVRGRDAAGNADATPASRSFTVDTAAPDTVLDLGPEGPTNDTTPQFAFSSEAEATFECRVDGDAFASCTSPHATAALADGGHRFEVRARDAAGNVDGTPASRSFVVDTAAPETAIDEAPSGVTQATGASVAFSADEAATFECTLDDGSFASCTSPSLLNALADGAHTFQVRATDDAGNTDASPATATWTVDTTPPETTIDSGPSGLTSDATPELAFSSEAGASFQCSLDDAPFAVCESPLTTATLADGAHTFAVRAMDDAGNTDGSPASRSFTVDTTSPETMIVAGPSTLTADATPTFEFASEAGATYECSLDAGAFSACATPLTTAELADGAHSFEVRAVDAAGNADGTPAGRDFVVDASAPDTTIDDGASGLTSSASASFSFSASEAGATFECALDDAGFAACTSPQSYTGLADGSHTFRARATDSAGNTDASPASRTWTIDSTTPETSIGSGPSGATNDATPTFAFSSEAGASFECRVGAGSLSACSSPHTTGPLGDGAHTFEVQARDAAGNVDATPAGRSFTVDTGVPAITLAGPPAQTSSTSAQLTFSASEAVTGFRCALDAAELASCASPVGLSGLALGQHTFRVEATDSAGNTGAATHAWTVEPPPDTAPPVISLAGPPAQTPATTAQLTFSASEAVTGFRCALDAAELAACTSPVSLSGLGLGQHTFRVEATDAADNTGSATHAWTIVPPPDTTAPVISLAGPPAGTTATTAQMTFSANEAVTGFRCALDTAALAACTSPVNLANLALGQHTFRVEANDSAGNLGAATHVWRVMVAPDTTAPVVTISGPPSSTPGTSATFTFTANEPAAFRCSLDSGAFANCASGVTYSGLGQGQHVFRVEATDAAQNQSVTGYTWTITDSSAPVVTITNGPQSPTSSTTATFQFSANEPVTFQCRRDGASFTSCSSGITYSGLAVGQHVFDVRATDGAGNVGSASYSWSVTAAPDTTAPVVTITQAPQSGTTSSTAQFTFSANEAATFRCSIDNGPFADCVSGVTYSGLGQGAHLFQVQGRDMAGNVGAANWGWTIASQPSPPPGGCTAQTLNLAANADTWVLQSSPTSNYGRDSVIKVDTKSGSNARVLVRFALPASVASCTVVDARLRLYAGSYKTGRTLLALPVAAAWNETAVTWNTQPATSGAGASAPSGSGYVEWNVKSLLPSSGNAGFLIRDATENGSGVEQGFNSREKGTDNPPVLVVSIG